MSARAVNEALDLNRPGLSEDWEPVATFGMSEDEVRSRLRLMYAGLLDRQLAELREDGFPLRVLEKARALAEPVQRESIEKALPMLMHNLALSAGGASLH